MRKDEMTPKQAERRMLITDILSSAGWELTENHKIFERGEWFPYQASLEYRKNEMVLGCEYEVAEDSLHVYIENDLGFGVRLIIKTDNKLETVLRTIISFQNEVSLDNYKEAVKKIVDVCPSGTYLDLGEEGLALIEDKDS